MIPGKGFCFVFEQNKELQSLGSLSQVNPQSGRRKVKDTEGKLGRSLRGNSVLSLFVTKKKE